VPRLPLTALSNVPRLLLTALSNVPRLMLSALSAMPHLLLIAQQPLLSGGMTHGGHRPSDDAKCLGAERRESPLCHHQEVVQPHVGQFVACTHACGRRFHSCQVVPKSVCTSNPLEGRFLLLLLFALKEPRWQAHGAKMLNTYSSVYNP